MHIADILLTWFQPKLHGCLAGDALHQYHSVHELCHRACTEHNANLGSHTCGTDHNALTAHEESLFTGSKHSGL